MEKVDNTIPWQHSHIFDDGNPLAERNTRWAVWLTAITMVVEIAGGWIYNSMALLADGWHMSSHAMALGLSVLAYGAARRLAHSKRFAFGTWKIEILGEILIMADQCHSPTFSEHHHGLAQGFSIS